MFPVLQVGPLALPAGPLALLIGAWLAAWLAEREAARLGLDADAVSTLVLVIYGAGLAGARLGYAAQFLGYAAQFLGVYAADPLSLLSPNPTTLAPIPGLLAAALGGALYGRRRGLPLWRTLDALAPGVAALLLALGVAHLASGDAFGTPASLPWSIFLWEAWRHPSQAYEIAAALVNIAAWRWARDRRPFDGFNLLLVVALAAAARVFVEAFRGDSAIVAGGLRAPQLVGLLVLAACLAALHLRARRALAAAPAG